MKSTFMKLGLISILFFTSNGIFAQFEISRSVIGNGGAAISNTDFTINSTLGQSAIDVIANSENSLWLGFWNANQLVVGINDEELLPDKFEIFQNYPNPFNPATKIKYSIPELSSVRLEVFNILGERIVTLIDQEQEPGYYIADFNASNLASGFYIYRIYTKGLNDSKQKFVEVKKMILLK